MEFSLHMSILSITDNLELAFLPFAYHFFLCFSLKVSFCIFFLSLNQSFAYLAFSHNSRETLEIHKNSLSFRSQQVKDTFVSCMYVESILYIYMHTNYTVCFSNSLTSCLYLRAQRRKLNTYPL